MNNKMLAGLIIALGVIFLIIGFVYATHVADTLPSYFPGFEAGSLHKHTKHSLAAIILGLGCFAYAWFQTGPKNLPKM